MMHRLAGLLLACLALSWLGLGTGLQAVAGEPQVIGASPSPVGGEVAAVGAHAPDFVLTDTEGKKTKLSSHLGEIVVLEWFNPDCPFVRHAHAGGPLKDMARTWTAQDVRWFAINSGAPGQQGTGVERNQAARAEWGMTHPVLLDETGNVGRAYGAKATPTIVIIDAAGIVRYIGALDDAPLGKGGTGKAYATDALTAVKAGGTVPVGVTKAYGCSVKYGS
jgi:peroxiredoxin